MWDTDPFHPKVRYQRVLVKTSPERMKKELILLFERGCHIDGGCKFGLIGMETLPLRDSEGISTGIGDGGVVRRRKDQRFLKRFFLMGIR